MVALTTATATMELVSAGRDSLALIVQSQPVPITASLVVDA